jgi:hypothetical protein
LANYGTHKHEKVRRFLEQSLCSQFFGASSLDSELLPALAFCDSGSAQHPEEFQGNAYHSLKIIALFCLAYARSASNPRTASGATVYGLNGRRANFVIALPLVIYEHAI